MCFIESIKYHHTYPLIGHCGLTSKWLNTDLIMCVHIYFLVLRLEITVETILSVLYKAVYCYRFGSDANVQCLLGYVVYNKQSNIQYMSL